MMDARCGVPRLKAQRLQGVTTHDTALLYLTAFQFTARVCLVFLGELKDFDAFANTPMPFPNGKGIVSSTGKCRRVALAKGSSRNQYH
jgi:hypothetical protein